MLYTEEEGEGVRVSGLGVTETVLLVEGVRPIDGVARLLALTGLAVPQLGDAWIDADAQDGLPVAVPATDAVVEPAAEGDPVRVAPLHVAQGVEDTVADHVFTVGVALPEVEPHDPVGVTVP